MLDLHDFTIVDQVNTGLSNCIYKATRKDDPDNYLIRVEKITNPETNEGTSEMPVHESLLLLILNNQERLRKQNSIFMELSGELFVNGLIHDFKSINKKTAEALDACRVSIWMYNQDNSALECYNLYDKCKNAYEGGQIIHQENYPHYFAALKAKQTIAAHDALQDARTKEFDESYLIPVGITSLLSIPIHIGNRMVGVFCIEHTGVKRVWQLEEQNFAGSLADISALVILSKEREEAQQETLRKEQFYKSLLENAFDSIIVKDANAAITYVTPSVRKFGFEPEELLGQTGFNFLNPKELEVTMASIEKVFCQPGASHTLIQQIRQKNGEYRTLELIARNMLHDEAVKGIVINFRDITDQQKAEQELVKKEKYFRALIENSFDVTFTRDADGIITYISPSVEHVLGYKPEELVGTLGFQLFPPETIPDFIDEGLVLSRNASGVLHKHLQLLRKDGRTIYVEAIARNLLNDEAINGYLIKFRDISDRLEAENKLIEKEKYFRSLIENSTDIISIADNDVNFFYATPAVERILGYTMEEYVTLNGAELVHPDYLPMVSDTYTHVIHHPDEQATIEFPFRHKDGYYVFLEVIFKNMLQDENVKGIVMNSREISERKKAEEVLKHYNEILRSEVQKQTISLTKKNEELEAILVDLKNAQMQLIQSEKMASLGQLTAGIAHEINNPINFVSANIDPLKHDFEEIQMLIDKYDGLHQSTDIARDLQQVKQLSREIDVKYLLEEIKALLTGVEEGAKRTKEIVIGLRNFSRLDESEKKLADIHEGLNSTLMLLRHKIKNRIAVDKEYGKLPLIECYPGKLNQVFMNILTNAIQAIPTEGTIGIRTWQKASSVYIAIRDSGTGIDKAVQDRIFDPFFTTKEVGYGTGLGLSISYGIIQRHNGKIEVSSEPGKGTEFIIVLPV